MSETTEQQRMELVSVDGTEQCRHCGNRGYHHEPVQVRHQDGTYSYEYLCPTNGGAE